MLIDNIARRMLGYRTISTGEIDNERLKSHPTIMGLYVSDMGLVLTNNKRKRIRDCRIQSSDGLLVVLSAHNGNDLGHLQVEYNNRTYYIHHLVNDTWPTGKEIVFGLTNDYDHLPKQVAHANNVPDDNRWHNLRETNAKGNALDRRYPPPSIV